MKDKDRHARSGVSSGSSRQRPIITKLYGIPPGRDAPKAERLRWVRRTAYLSNLPWLLLVAVTAALVGVASWLWVLLGVSALAWLVGYVTINVQLRRAELRRDG